MTLKPNNGAPWSPGDIAKLELMRSQKAERAEIAAALGRTEAAIDAKSRTLQRQKGGRRKIGKRQQRRVNCASFFLS